MNEKYNKYVKCFSNLDIEDKKQEILKHLLELINLLTKINNDLDTSVSLPILNDYAKDGNDDEYYNQLFTYVISLKEETAKLIETIK